jgi:hypothetical protein
MADLVLRTSEACSEIYAALAAAQGEMHAAPKDSANPFFKSKYADLASVIDAIRAPFAKFKLCVIQAPKYDSKLVTVTTRIGHASGQWLECELSLAPVKHDPQAIGSAITYGRRYTLQPMTGVAAEDDDGNAASAPRVEKEAAAPVALDENDRLTVKAYHDTLVAKPPIDKLNNMIPELKEYPPHVRKALWPMVREYASANGWELDKRNSPPSFYIPEQPAPTGDAY